MGSGRGPRRAIYQPNYNWPALRVGHFQPSIGMRYDDHTMLVRQTPMLPGAASLIAPNYAEYGAEVHYYKKLWLSQTGGDSSRPRPRRKHRARRQRHTGLFDRRPR